MDGLNSYKPGVLFYDTKANSIIAPDVTPQNEASHRLILFAEGNFIEKFNNNKKKKKKNPLLMSLKRQ